MEKGVPGVDYTRKTDFYWTSMIRLPEFVTDEVFAWAKASFASKHPEVDINRGFFDFDEGVVAQVIIKAPVRRRACNRDDSGRLRAFARLRARLLRHPPPSRDLPIRPAPSQTGKSQNHHPSSGSEGGLTFGELLEGSPRSSVNNLPESLPGSKSATKNSISKITRSTGSSRRDSARATL